MRHVHEPFTLRKHPKLQEDINEMMIAIKLHYSPAPNDEEFKDRMANWAKAKANHRQPTWDDVLQILDNAYRALDEQRYDPIKY